MVDNEQITKKHSPQSCSAVARCLLGLLLLLSD